MPVLQFNPRKPSSSSDSTRSFESPTAEIIGQQHPLAKRSVLYVLALFIGLIITFISLAHLDRVVTTQGRIVPVTGALTVQPLDKAIISSILVSVGDTVKKGQVLATLDPTFVHADLGELQQKLASLTPQKRRIEAEEAGKPFLADPSQPFDVVQDALYKQRAVELESGILDFDQRIHGSEADAAALRQDLTNYEGQLKIARETEDMNAKLAADGIISHLQMIGIQNQRIEAERKLGETQNKLASTEHTLESLKQQRQVFIDKWHDDNLTNLVTVKNQLEEAAGDLTKARKHSDLANLVAPMDAVVLMIPKLSMGGVATDAEPLFSLMPLNAPLQADVQIDTKDSGFVKVGDPVRIKFDAYKFLEHGTAEGVVKTISHDAFTEASTQDMISPRTETAAGEKRTPYYDARITITAVKLHDVPSPVRLIPGMTLQADIVVGRRTILWYVLGGALRSGAEAMREP
ncbi:MAG: HlyD family type I secretion periplasmic adaptor subunit [Bryobacteraceae bacterium]